MIALNAEPIITSSLLPGLVSLLQLAASFQLNVPAPPSQLTAASRSRCSRDSMSDTRSWSLGRGVGSDARRSRVDRDVERFHFDFIHPDQSTRRIARTLFVKERTATSQGRSPERSVKCFDRRAATPPFQSSPTHERGGRGRKCRRDWPWKGCGKPHHPVGRFPRSQRKKRVVAMLVRLVLLRMDSQDLDGSTRH